MCSPVASSKAYVFWSAGTSLRKCHDGSDPAQVAKGIDSPARHRDAHDILIRYLIALTQISVRN